MKTLLNGAMCAVLVIIIGACTPYVTRKQYDQVRTGMSRAQVEEVFDGKRPQERRIAGNREIWLLDVLNFYSQTFSGRQIVFENDQVASLGPSPERQALINAAARRRAEARRAAAVAEQQRIERQQLIGLEADRLATRRAEARALESQSRYVVVQRPGIYQQGSGQARPVQQNYAFDFYGLLSRIRAKGHPNHKVALIRDAAGSAYFSCSQVLTLFKEFPHSSDKMKVLELLSRRISDPQNRYTIVEAFTFSRDKEKARRILGL